MVNKLFKSNKLAAALACLLAPWCAQAQSNVTIYGILDGGVTVVDNAGGSSLTLLDTGVMQASRLGFRGSEDLGGGLRANFVLEQGLLLDTGALGQGGLAWGRQSWVGLSSDSLGSVMLGRQYDLMFDALVAFHTPTVSAGGYSNNLLDNDRASGQRLNNSVKYRSPNLGGLTFSVMGAVAEGAANAAGKAKSAGLTYSAGPLKLGAAYTYVYGATLDIRSIVTSATPVIVGGQFSRTYGLGGSYTLAQATTFHTMYSEAEFSGASSASSATFRNVELGVAHRTGPWNLGLAYAHTTLQDRDNKYQQIDVTADYFLSKRTDVYAQVIAQNASGNGARAAIFLLPGSSTDEQAAFRVGLRHAF